MVHRYGNGRLSYVARESCRRNISKFEKTIRTVRAIRIHVLRLEISESLTVRPTVGQYDTNDLCIQTHKTIHRTGHTVISLRSLLTAKCPCLPNDLDNSQTKTPLNPMAWKAFFALLFVNVKRTFFIDEFRFDALTVDIVSNRPRPQILQIYE